jgi:hypothetical protein
MIKDYREIAAEMFFPDELSPSLIDMLNDTATLVQRSGGILRSRQVIASIITMWRLRYTSYYGL